MIVKRIGPASAAKITGILYAAIGLLVGAMFAAIGTVFSAFFPPDVQESGGPFVAALFGVGAVVVLPILYGVLGAIGGLIGAAIYNLAAGIVGGLEVDLQ